jgi:hypothetical protein
LVHYVGKGDGAWGIEGRLEAEWRDFRNGLYWWPVRLDAFRGGCQLDANDPKEREVARQVEALGPAFRIIVSRRIDGNRRRCENELVCRLRKDDYTEQFLYRTQCRGRGYHHAPDVDIPAFDEPRIIGLNVGVPLSLRDFVDSWRR